MTQSPRAPTPDTRLVHHHVGARGNVPLPLTPESPLRGDFTSYYYDADEQCVDQVRGRIKVGQSHVLSQCIGARRERRTFNLTYDRFCSSLFDLNPDYAEFCSPPSRFGESRYGTSLSTVDRVEVDIRTLDELCASDEVSPPDYLSIDAEGATWDIMSGARQVLEDHVLLFRAEMEFHPFRSGSRLFGDIFNRLSDLGFMLVDIEPFQPVAALHLPIGLRGGGFQLGCEARFLRRSDDVITRGDPAASALRLAKLAALSVLIGNFAYAFKVAAQARDLSPTLFTQEGDASGVAYLRLLSEMLRLRDAWPKLPLPQFHDIYSAELARLRHKDIVSEADRAQLKQEKNAARKRVLDRYTPHILKILRFYNFPAASKQATVFERLLTDHGLQEQAQAVAEERRSNAEWTMQLLSELDADSHHFR